MAEWQRFEAKTREKFRNFFGVSLEEGRVCIKGKCKSFDMVNETGHTKYVGDVKFYKDTKSGNIPIGKRSTVNEYVWLLQKLPRKNYRKFIVIGEDEKMARKYVADFTPWLDEVEIYFFKRRSKPIRLYPE